MAIDRFAVAEEVARSYGARFRVIGGSPRHDVARAFGVIEGPHGLYQRKTYVIGADRVIRAVIDDAHDMLRHSREALAAVRRTVIAPTAAGDWTADGET